MILWCPDKFNKAWNFATIAHHGQFYGGKEQGVQIDYINHLGSVAMEIIWALDGTPNCDADLALQCALLHDVIEDTQHTYEEVTNIFGEAVGDGVLALSKNPQLPGRKAQMINSLARIKLQPREVWMVKLADRITNLNHPPYYWKADKKLAYREEAWLIYGELKEANPKLSERLLSKIEEYSKFIE